VSNEEGTGFGARLRQLRQRRGLSIQKLAFAFYDVDRNQSFDSSFISKIERGERNPSPAFIHLVGEVLDPSVEEFPEYHLAMMRRALDERAVGLDQAMANLRRLDTAVQAEEDAESLSAYLTAQGETLEAALASPSEEDQPASGAGSARRRKGRAST
jgi:transcriptional regulator with XRE-family HTH domain